MSAPPSDIQKLLNDPTRLAVVKSILETDQKTNEEYDKFTRLAAKMFKADCAVFCVMDRDQEHKKSSFGLGGNVGMIVDRDKCHQSFEGSQFSFEFKNLYFLGTPLKIQNYIVGTLYLIVKEKRDWSEEELEGIKDLSSMLETKIKFEISKKNLQVSEARFQTIIEQSPYSIQIFSMDGKPVLMNPAWQKLWGISDEFVQNFIMKEYNVLEDPILKNSGQLESIKKIFAGEVVALPISKYDPSIINSPEGRARWIHAMGYPLRDPKGEVKEVVCIHHDVTDEVEETEARTFLAAVTKILISSLDYNEVTEKVATSAIPILADGCMVDIVENGTIKRLLMKHIDPKVELLMKTLLTQFQPSLNSPQPSARVIRSGEPELIEDVNLDEIIKHTISAEHADLIKRIGINSHIAVPFTIRGKITGSMSLLNTTNRRKFTQKDLALAEELCRLAAMAIDNARLYRNAQNAVQQREDFISIASHELKTPLTSLKLQMDLATITINRAEDGMIDAPFVQKLSEVSNRQIDRLTRLVDDMLDLSRISTGKLLINKQPVEFSEILEEVLARFSDQLLASDIELKMIPFDKAWVNGDSFRLEQVISNLMTNAIRYGRKEPIEVSLTNSDKKAILKISDHGHGIDADDYERIFQRFERSTSSIDISGLGLGLFITREIVEEHKGKVFVESQMGKGSTFTVELPLIR